MQYVCECGIEQEVHVSTLCCNHSDICNQRNFTEPFPFYDNTTASFECPSMVTATSADSTEGKCTLTIHGHPWSSTRIQKKALLPHNNNVFQKSCCEVDYSNL